MDSGRRRYNLRARKAGEEVNGKKKVTSIQEKKIRLDVEKKKKIVVSAVVKESEKTKVTPAAVDQVEVNRNERKRSVANVEDWDESDDVDERETKRRKSP